MKTLQWHEKGTLCCLPPPSPRGNFSLLSFHPLSPLSRDRFARTISLATPIGSQTVYPVFCTLSLKNICRANMFVLFRSHSSFFFLFNSFCSTSQLRFFCSEKNIGLSGIKLLCATERRKNIRKMDKKTPEQKQRGKSSFWFKLRHRLRKKMKEPSYLPLTSCLFLSSFPARRHT